ncbi:hypothetical protein [Salinispora cortesiana]|uniref:hypothetical protein n=1 Tax=Salinispora cortesiana TaxID=1305843 RepID=UPI000405F44F
MPNFTQWPSFPFEGDLRVKQLDDPVATEPHRRGEGDRECTACGAPDEAYIWADERWRVRAMDRPTGLPMVLILESRSHLDLGDLPNLLAAELGVLTVRLERAIRSLDGVSRVHVNRWGDGSAHLHLWFLARPHGQLQLRGTFLPLWDSILPPIPESTWRENLALVAAWLADFGGRQLAEPTRIQWQAPASFGAVEAVGHSETAAAEAEAETARGTEAAETALGEGSSTFVARQRSATGSGGTAQGGGTAGSGGAVESGGAEEPDAAPGGETGSVAISADADVVPAGTDVPAGDAGAGAAEGGAASARLAVDPGPQVGGEGGLDSADSGATPR